MRFRSALVSNIRTTEINRDHHSPMDTETGQFFSLKHNTLRVSRNSRMFLYGSMNVYVSILLAVVSNASCGVLSALAESCALFCLFTSAILALHLIVGGLCTEYALLGWLLFPEASTPALLVSKYLTVWCNCLVQAPAAVQSWATGRSEGLNMNCLITERGAAHTAYSARCYRNSFWKFLTSFDHFVGWRVVTSRIVSSPPVVSFHRNTVHVVYVAELDALLVLLKVETLRDHMVAGIPD